MLRTWMLECNPRKSKWEHEAFMTMLFGMHILSSMALNCCIKHETKILNFFVGEKNLDETMIYILDREQHDTQAQVGDGSDARLLYLKL